MCIKLLEGIVAIKRTQHDANIESWKWIKRIINQLGHDGMSSDDSNCEQETLIIKTLQTRRMPWRRDLTRIIELLDHERRLDKSVFQLQGSLPVPRTRNLQALASSRPMVFELPLAFYDKQWYASLTEEQREELEVPKKNFIWHSFAVGR